MKLIDEDNMPEFPVECDVCDSPLCKDRRCRTCAICNRYYTDCDGHTREKSCRQSGGNS